MTQPHYIDLAPCPFCGSVPERVGAFSAQCRGMVDGKEVHNTIVMNNAAWNRRPAPMEAVAWFSEWQGIGGPARALHGTEQEAIDSAEWMGGRVQALAVIPTQGLGSSAAPIPTCDSDTAVVDPEHLCEWRLIAETQDAQYARVQAMIEAAKEAGWAMMEVVDGIAWERRQQFSDIATRLAMQIASVEGQAAPASDTTAGYEGSQSRSEPKNPIPTQGVNPDLREKVETAIHRAMIDGQGDQDIIQLATNAILSFATLQKEREG